MFSNVSQLNSQQQLIKLYSFWGIHIFLSSSKRYWHLNLENDYNLSIFRFLIIAYLPFLGNSILNYLHKNITLRINIAKLSIARHIRPVIVGYWFEKCHFFVFMQNVHRFHGIFFIKFQYYILLLKLLLLLLLRSNPEND